MKSIKYLFISLLAIGLFSSCEEVENSAEPSTITYLPLLEMNGSANITLPCGTTEYTDEGLNASEGGNDLDVTTSISGKYFGSSTVNGPDVYSISYSAYNQDSIPGAAERTVVWEECNGDFVTSIAGMYTADCTRNGSISAPYIGMGPIMVKDLGNGQYQLSDAIGGYYDFGRGYGYHYAALGLVVTANDIGANDFSYPSEAIGVGDFGGELLMTDFSVDAGAKTISFTTEWSFGYTFEVVLTQM